MRQNARGGVVPDLADEQETAHGGSHVDGTKPAIGAL